MVTGFGRSRGPGEIQQSRVNTAKQRIRVIAAVLRIRRVLEVIYRIDACLERSAPGAIRREYPHRHSACQRAPVRRTFVVRPGVHHRVPFISFLGSESRNAGSSSASST